MRCARCSGALTGNAVFLGFALAGAPNLSALASAVAPVSFLLGALFGGRLGTRFATHRGHLLAAATAVEAALVAVAVAVTAVTGDRVTTGVQYTLSVCRGLGPGLQKVVARHLKVPDLTTTVLTPTLTGLAADSTPAGGVAPKPGRRMLSVTAMPCGALAGAECVLHGELVLTLCLAPLLLLLVSAVTHRLSDTDAPWIRPPS